MGATERLLELGAIFRSDGGATARATWPKEELARLLIEYRALQKELRPEMSRKLQAAEKQLDAMAKRRQELENEHSGLGVALVKAQNDLGAAIADGGDVEKLTSQIEKLEREKAALAEGVKAAEKREKAAAMGVVAAKRQTAADEAEKRKKEIERLRAEILGKFREVGPLAEELGEQADQLHHIVAPFQEWPEGFDFYWMEPRIGTKLARDAGNVAARFVRRWDPKA